MEPQRKKLKTKLNPRVLDKSIDPLGLHSKKLYSLIFQHLSGSDLLELSETSRQCYQLVAASDGAMDKIQLVINEGSNRVFKWSDLENSKRKYKTLKVKNLLTGRQEVARLIIKFSHLLTSIETNYDFKLQHEILLRSLKILIMTVTSKSEIYYDGLLTSTSKLTKFHFSGFTQEYMLIYECLENNSGLKELILERGAPKIVFQFMIVPIDLKLTTLKCDDVDFSSERGSQNFFNFVELQGDTLKELKLFRCELVCLTDFLHFLPNVVKLTYSPPASEDPCYSINFSTHHQIRELNLITTPTKNIKLLTSIAPRVEKLYIADISSILARTPLRLL